MNQKDNSCQKPEKLQGKVGECSPEQIQECHGHEKITEIKCSCADHIGQHVEIDCQCLKDGQ